MGDDYLHEHNEKTALEQKKGTHARIDTDRVGGYSR
jgi:hypothetical protein